jgi:hypothetical protein
MGPIYFPIDQHELLILNAASGEKSLCMLRFVQLILQCAMFMIETRADGFAFLKCPAATAALNGWSESSIHHAAR